MEERVKVLCDGGETVKGFCYLGDRLNASGGLSSDHTGTNWWHALPRRKA